MLSYYRIAFRAMVLLVISSSSARHCQHPTTHNPPPSSTSQFESPKVECLGIKCGILYVVQLFSLLLDQ